MTFDPPPGRIMATGGTHTFAELSRAIDLSFGRWDLAQMHVFDLRDGQMIGPVDEYVPMDGLDDEELAIVGECLRPGQGFTYTFDLRSEWVHTCHVAKEPIDPRDELGEVPLRPVVLWGWGNLPDQHGRITAAG